MRVSPVALSATLAFAAAAVLAGCAGQSSASAPMGQTATAPIVPMSHIDLSESMKHDTASGAIVGIKLEGQKPGTSKKYGKVLGYFNGATAKKSEVVMLSPNENVTFTNGDEIEHTASFLGDATKKSAPWPSSFVGQEAASSPGTDIGTTGFSTGPLKPASNSSIYSSGAPGFYMVGCFFHYVEAGMRTVIIVK